METIAKIRAEIVRRMKELRGQEKDFLEQDCHTLVEDARLRIGELNQLLSFLDTLEEESVDIRINTPTYSPISTEPEKDGSTEIPTNLDLEKEIGKVFFSQNFEDDHGRFSVQLSTKQFSNIARHFYELGLNGRNAK